MARQPMILRRWPRFSAALMCVVFGVVAFAGPAWAHQIHIGPSAMEGPIVVQPAQGSPSFSSNGAPSTTQAPAASPASPAPATSPRGGSLAFTGWPFLTATALGACFLVVGSGIWLTSRRRSRRTT